MAVTRGTPTAVGGPTQSTSLSVPLPATVTTDGVLVMRVSNTNIGATTVNTPAGWTLIDNQHDAANASQYLFWKPADASDSGGSVTVTTSDGTKAYRYQVVQLLGADRTNPFPHVLGGAMAAAATSLTTGALTIHSTNPSGKKYLLAFMQAGGFFTYSAETANGFTSPTLDEFVDTQGALAALIQASTSTATSTFSVTMSASNRAAWTIMDIAEASAGVTGTAAQTLPAFTQAADGTRTIPPRTGSVVTALAAFTQAATGTRTVPTSTGTAASGLQPLAQSATGTRTVPTSSGAAASGLAALTQAATGTVAAPVFSGSADSALAATTQAADGTHTPPTFAGSADSALASLGQSADGSTTAPVFTGSADSTLALLEQEAAGSFAVGGTTTSVIPKFTQSAAGTHAAPAFDGSAASDLPAFTQSAAGAYVVPPVEAVAGSVLAALGQSVAGTTSGPIFTAAAASVLVAVTQSALGYAADLPCLILRPTGRTARVLATTARPSGVTDRPGCD